jgi:hypothetical protein
MVNRPLLFVNFLLVPPPRFLPSPFFEGLLLSGNGMEIRAKKLLNVMFWVIKPE